ncbi:MAG: FG-GAP-like repeat-containing protein [Rhodobacter sp.]|nr:FG-GAP-like repeat-containing protein [Rhodobacter sp.]
MNGSGLIAKSAEKRLVFALLMIAVLAGLFWTGSRYPALDEKAMMSGAIQLEDPISFEAVFPVTPNMPVTERIAKSTVNWVDTNKKGMTFGVLIAAAFLTLFGYLKRRSFAGAFSNSALGLVMGAPLGVCVNCAAPIARGLYSGGMRAEATLSAMIASPTLNIIVLTMLFSLLPVYMALAKIGLSLLVILVAVPLICRLLPKAELQLAPDAMTVPAPEGWDLDSPQETLVQALAGYARAYAANLWFIIKTTVPLMLLAGFLGATAGTLLPQDLILGATFSVLVLILVAVVGTFLPVPIAFDVVVAGALLSGGLTHGYVFALLFTLGSFSVYSYLIVASTISVRAATLLGAVIVGLGILGGAAAHTYHTWQTQRALDMLLGLERAVLPAAEAADYRIASDLPIRIEARPFAPRSPATDTVFQRVEAWTAGIDKPLEFSMKDMWPPFWEGRSLSTGDIDRDGDLDLVIASTERGLYLYANDGGGRFSRIEADLGALGERDIFNAALVDLDNDGWLDLFLATYLDGNFTVANRGGAFDFAKAAASANREDTMLVMALTFGDIDRDGDLDAALGNWAAGWYRRIPGEESRNRLIFNEGGALDGSRFADLPGLPGETLTILLSDIDTDGALDLLVGNDFELPDYVYYGDGRGGFDPVTRDQGLIEHTTNTTMAIRTADLHNDGTMEMYFAQIAGRSSGVSDTLKMQHLSQYCAGIVDGDARTLCERNMEIKTWYKSGNRFDPTYAGKCEELTGALKAECKGMLVKDLAIQKQDPSICGFIASDQTQARAYCDIHFKPREAPLQAVFDTTIPQIRRSNVLLTRAGAGYQDTAEAEGLEVGGWSWDTKIADFDNDGWQDVYIVNGTWVPNEVSPSNLFFHNQGDGSFVEASGPFGLEDYLMTAAAVAFDMDHDGDLDVITQPVNGPVALFRNGSQDGNAVRVELRDAVGNSHGVGARVVAELADGTQMMRELTSGGGFMSFDAPVAHFGLGAAEVVARLTVHWPAGGVSEIAGPIAAGATYTVHRGEG